MQKEGQFTLYSDVWDGIFKFFNKRGHFKPKYPIFEYINSNGHFTSISPSLRASVKEIKLKDAFGFKFGFSSYHPGHYYFSNRFAR